MINSTTDNMTISSQRRRHYIEKAREWYCENIDENGSIVVPINSNKADMYWEMMADFLLDVIKNADI